MEQELGFTAAARNNYTFLINKENHLKSMINLYLLELKEEKNINVLVLAARIDEKGPGPIISELTTKEYARLRIPIMIVPGNFSKDHISQIT